MLSIGFWTPLFNSTLSNQRVNDLLSLMGWLEGLTLIFYLQEAGIWNAVIFIALHAYKLLCDNDLRIVG